MTHQLGQEKSSSKSNSDLSDVHGCLACSIIVVFLTVSTIVVVPLIVLLWNVIKNFWGW